MSHGNSQETGPLVSLIAGGTAGGIEATLTYPFEFAKTRVQLKSDGTVYSKNPFKVVGDVIKQEGITALYKGCSSLVIGTVAKDAIRFMTFDRIKAAFEDKETGQLSAIRSLLAGMSAGVVASTFAVTPTERIKTALIDDARSSGPRRFRGAIHATTTLVAENGLRDIYRGYATTTLKQMGTTSVRMGSYNILKDYESARNIPQTTLVNFGNGAVAGIVTTYLTQPFDVIKTRAQSAKGAGTVEAFNSIMADYGVRGFWKGTVMRLGRTVFAGGILFTAYESTVKVLKTVLPQYD
ncbi:tricarboxylate transport protein, mitochondrial precursor [Myriangium duriaei CBS 260.36]|uniref:Tricarboxylate transport protein, mitochondrial n=1 Tax=Myriangium duriaei CBS 260.36 TaxID=1168546 RepID=A0A9P4IQ74_9PEZI|nr:tricarboxylate transport protein, mitochondrial precursor [Myriangium duriaei CBS 260.36]